MKNKFAGIILAGGNSRRMGQDKYELKIGNQTLLERTIDVLKPFVDQIIVVFRSSEKNKYHSNPEQRIVYTFDSIPDKGPLQGISDGLQAVKSDLNNIYILSCDLPFISHKWLTELKNQYQQSAKDGVVTLSDNISNPLIAIYHRNVLATAHEKLKAGCKRPIDLWVGFDIEKLCAEGFDKHTIKDMNTPDAYQFACDYYQNHK